MGVPLLKLAIALAVLATVTASLSTEVIQSYEQVRGKPYKVTYDRRSMMIDGKRSLLLGGTLHYPRSTPGMWDDLFSKAKDHGLNMVETEVFWNYHEKIQGQFDFTNGSANLPLWLQKAQKHGLFVVLRVGPYICAEYNFGGLPIWIRNMPGLQLRTYTEPWMSLSKNWLTRLMPVIRPYLAENGGPVIVMQIENEYGFGDSNYVRWNGELAASLAPNVVWIMCNGEYANNTINTCNGCDCDTWVDQHWSEQPNTPAMFTENEGWFEMWSTVRAIRDPENIASSAVRFIAYGGSLHLYYMFHGGNHYDYGTSAAGLTTFYGNDVQLRPDGTRHEPKWSHLTRMHKVLMAHSSDLLNNAPTQPALVEYFNGVAWVFAPNTSLQARTYGGITFLVNTDIITYAARWNKKVFDLQPDSVSIVDKQGNILFNTAVVEGFTSPSGGFDDWEYVVQHMTWKWWQDDPLLNPVKKPVTLPADQLLYTLDMTDFAYYTTKVMLPPNTTSINMTMVAWPANLLTIVAPGYTLAGTANDVDKDNYYVLNHTTTLTFPPNQPQNTPLYILSHSLGLSNDMSVGTPPTQAKGLAGKITLGQKDITNNAWTIQVGLTGEVLRVFDKAGSAKVHWQDWYYGLNKTLSWFQTSFRVPPKYAARSISVDIQGLSHGRIWVNGKTIGRFLSSPGTDVWDRWCFALLESNMGQPLQRQYHIPPDYLIPNGDNLLSIFDEVGGDPTTVTISTRVLV
jgi:hypothetical protein